MLHVSQPPRKQVPWTAETERPAYFGASGHSHDTAKVVHAEEARHSDRQIVLIIPVRLGISFCVQSSNSNAMRDAPSPDIG